MIKIRIPKIVRPLHLKDYAPEYGDYVIQVWVNPPRRLRNELNNIVANQIALTEVLKAIAENGNSPDEVGKIYEEMEQSNNAYFAWMAEIWSQGEGEGETAESVRDIATAAQEEDPGLWDFLRNQTLIMIDEYIGGSKKK